MPTAPGADPALMALDPIHLPAADPGRSLMTTLLRMGLIWSSLGGSIWFGLAPGPAVADDVYLKSGEVYRGTVDKDNTLVFVSDSLKRTVFYNSKIARTESNGGFQNFERFQLVQPLEVHAGLMTNVAVDISASPWDAKGRRAFQYKNARLAKIAMQQAINEISPHMTRYRGIDGFWVGQVATSQVPRAVILGLLAKVEQANENERLRVARFLIQAQWFDEAKAALDQLERDFPKLQDTVGAVRRSVAESQARDALIEAATARQAQQPLRSLQVLRSIADPKLPREILDEARDQVRRDEDQAALDRNLANRLLDLADKLSEADRPAWRGRTAEVLKMIAQAPEVARARLDPAFRDDPARPAALPEARFARAMSGWVVGPDGAVDSLATAATFWQARQLVQNYLVGRDEAARREPRGKEEPPRPPDDPVKVRSDVINGLDGIQRADNLSLDTVDLIVERMVPPLDEARGEETQTITTHRVIDDENPSPTEYAVLLPPEYHPLRTYPTVVALHDGHGPRSAVEWVAGEAAKRGYIVIAPEYTNPDKGPSYRYSAEEHAAVQLSLRDARKRYSIDSNRVFLAGQLAGADMTWDFGLAHPDLFAGIIPVSGFPAKYAYKYKAQVDKLPLYVVLGELAPAAREVVFDQFVRPLIENVEDVTYVDYLRRGLEPLPEEVPAMFAWMANRRRDPAPRTFEVATARDSDARFYGVVVQEITPGRSTTPETADPLGKNIRPASIKLRTSTQGNLLNLTTSGINRFDLWVSPRLIDFKRKMEIRQNDRVVYRGQVKPDFALMLEDLRVRGDRQQLYHWKVVVGGSKPRGR